ncbi:Tad domain-containing protein [Anaerovibrio lipolyticus]|uniref:Tad domain-containing protein n=1 Tax=Anaerovibrio lipolyticus TaxID=82374 RepID=UPI001F1F7220|nr:Tad domain-containing protein [Anaerovibrio lipolyticus]MCF2601491.1 Tad domain-containing protein [Anaerovibrio lipolyticus]
MTCIWRKCLTHWNKCRQKGQILVFTAVLLPLLIAACGFTVDFGNMYMHKSRLQNAADAAAIAGGYAFRDNKENIDYHPKADNASKESAKSNLTNFDNIGRLCQARVDKAGVIYYRVELSESVPVYFLSFFGVGDSTNVTAESFAQIAYTGGSSGGSLFDNLFSYGSGGFRSINASQNPDNPSISQILDASFYQGRIVGMGADADMTKNYRHELLNLNAKTHYQNGSFTSMQDAINYSNAHPDDTMIVTPEQDLNTSLDYKLAEILGNAKADLAKNKLIWTNENNIGNIKAQVMSKDIDYIYNPTTDTPQWGPGNTEFKINDYIPANDTNKNNPLFVVVDPPKSPWGYGTHKLTLQGYNMPADSRPIVYVYTGTGTINIEANNATFYGAIYAPYANIHMNDQGLTFHGSILSKGLEITGKSTYIYKKFLSDSAGTGSSGNGTASSNATVGLTSPPSDISWD